MKRIYFVIEKQLESVADCEETTGVKSVRAYEIKEGKLVLLCEITTHNNDNSEQSLLNELEKKNLIGTTVNLIEL